MPSTLKPPEIGDIGSTRSWKREGGGGQGVLD